MFFLKIWKLEKMSFLPLLFNLSTAFSCYYHLIPSIVFLTHFTSLCRSGTLLPSRPIFSRILCLELSFVRLPFTCFLISFTSLLKYLILRTTLNTRNKFTAHISVSQSLYFLSPLHYLFYCCAIITIFWHPIEFIYYSYCLPFSSITSMNFWQVC